MAGKIEDIVVFKDPGVYVLGIGVPFKSPVVLPDANETIVHVSSSDEHAALVCASGRVYTFGRTSDHAWMMENKFNKPTLVPGLEDVKVVQADCGDNFTVFLTDKGKLYSCGVNTSGQLGQGTTEDNPTPTLITDLPHIKTVCAGCEYTVALTNDGVVFVCGRNDNGQTGLDDRYTETFTKLPDADLPIIDVACGYYHTALLTVGKYMLISGWNNYGQVSVEKECKEYSCVSIPSVSNMACGSYYTVALAKDNTVWAWGCNDYGQLGNGTTYNQLTPTRVVGLEGHVIKNVFAGVSSTAFVTDRGNVFVCGRYFGAKVSVPHLLQMAEGLAISRVAFGSAYSVFLVNEAALVLPPTKKLDDIKVQNHVSTPAPITDSERLLMDSLECPVCFKVMSGPIHLCTNGHNLCDSCFLIFDIRVCPTCRAIFTQGRNVALESIASETQLPCLDCLVRVPVPELMDHPVACAKRQYNCPLDQTCNWSGLRGALLSHATSDHLGLVHKDSPYTFSLCMSGELLTTELLVTHDELFTLHKKYKSIASEAQIAVGHIGPPDDANKFVCRLEWNAGSLDWTSAVVLKVHSYNGHFPEEIYCPEHCVSLKKTKVQKFMLNASLPCKISVIKF